MSARRDEVLRAALGLLDEVGLDDLTTRRLADRLGVRPSALYRHFASKQALLDAMVTHIASAASADEPAMNAAADRGDWVTLVRLSATAARAGMLVHRDGARLMATFVEPSPEVLVNWRRFIAVLASAGLTEPMAIVAVDTIFSYVNGFAIEEQARSGGGRPRADRDRTFASGLELIITGIRAALPVR
ncbi:MAG TPA: TetR/AcrR family transcriptional regulator C-terminal domain-containing protein [Pseudonocardiaceae bacterium]|jgi:TetR/AcrR family tetracycline transcriptional repressor|nr:TetR/AcrR family transcriptional regulator C-terminal domain-containing protein [Pseudonocardiaceae bacterium]